jgi:hypothetical protein
MADFWIILKAIKWKQSGIVWIGFLFTKWNMFWTLEHVNETSGAVTK